MILLDANVLLIDLKYNNDTNFVRNRDALAALAASGIPLAVPTQVVIEVVGVLSFNISAATVTKIGPAFRHSTPSGSSPTPRPSPTTAVARPRKLSPRWFTRWRPGTR